MAQNQHLDLTSPMRSFIESCLWQSWIHTSTLLVASAEFLILNYSSWVRSSVQLIQETCSEWSITCQLLRPLSLMSTVGSVLPLLRVKPISFLIQWAIGVFLILILPSFYSLLPRHGRFWIFVDLFAKRQAYEKGCEREARWHYLSQFKEARYLVVYNLSMLVVCTVDKSIFGVETEPQDLLQQCRQCLSVGWGNGLEGRKVLGPGPCWTSDSSCDSGKVRSTQFCCTAEISPAAELNLQVASQWYIWEKWALFLILGKYTFYIIFSWPSVSWCSCGNILK